MMLSRLSAPLRRVGVRSASGVSGADPSMSGTFHRVEFRKPDPKKPKLVLAYSGGLDTSTQLAYLHNEKGFEVCAMIADLGQDDVLGAEAKKAIAMKAKASGAYAFYCEDLRKEFVEDFVFPMVAANAVYEGRYLLGTSIARPCIGKRQVEICHKEHATHISHGSTGKGNDQVRFELTYLGMDPTLKCVTLWRDPTYFNKFPGRQALLDYAAAHNIPVSQTKKHSYSEDENCMHISYESGELEDPAFPGAKHEYPGKVLKKKTKDLLDTPDKPALLTVAFEKGIPVAVKNESDGKTVKGSFELFDYLNKVGGEHGVGRIDIVENRFVGMKSRGCYETPGGTILFSAHHDLEVLCLDREVMRIRDQLSLKYAELIYNGFWFSPEMAFLKNSMEFAQKVVTGTATVQLHKGNVYNRGRASPNTLYNTKIVSMDEHGGFDPTAATGFINTLSTRLKASKKRDVAMGIKW
jgi:argininosuccinate synthase